MAVVIKSYEIPLKEALKPALTFSITDIKDPSSVKSNYSKTITLPSSKELDKLFNHIFEINIETLTFNPNKRLDVEYLVNELRQIEGYLKLDEVIINDHRNVEYKVSIFGESGDLFSKLGDKKLTDLTGLDDYNHARNTVNIKDSWDNTIQKGGASVPFALGQGYLYPLINYGFNSDLTKYSYNHLMPAIYVKEYIDRIFADAGKTYTSNFLSADNRLKSLVVPFNGNNIQLTSAQIADRLFRADAANQVVTTSDAVIIYPNEVSDAGNNYSTVTGEYTVPDSGFYDFSSTIDVKAEYTPSGNVVDVFLNKFAKVKIDVYRNGSILLNSAIMYLGDETIAIPTTTTYDTGANVAYPSDAHSTNISTSPANVAGSISVFIKTDNKKTNPASNLRVAFNETLLTAGDTITMVASYLVDATKYVENNAGEFRDGLGNYFSGTTTVTINSGKLQNNITKSEVAEGGLIDMYSVVPKKATQRDFLRSIISMFKLNLEPDNDNPNNYRIEPDVNFFTTIKKDWSGKRDISKDLTIEPMGLLEASEYLYKYKDDKDYYNESYKGEKVETYGQRSGLIDNDFVKNTVTKEIIFSPTPIVGQSDVDMVIPTIIKNDPNQYLTTEHNIRILYYGGLKTTTTAFSLVDASGGELNFSQYPYSGHFDDPYNPTFDINFGLPKKVYYDNTFNDITATNNNLFNVYHLDGLKQIAQRDSKLVSGHFLLSPSDINQISFRPLYYFDNAYFRLYKVENYDPNKPLTKCYFIKLINATLFTPSTTGVNGGSGDIATGFDDGVGVDETTPEIGHTQLRNGNFSGDTKNSIQGNDNYISPSAKSISIKGDNNKVEEYAKDITLVNSDFIIIKSGVENVTLINSNNLTIDESDVTYINGVVFGASVGGSTVVDFGTTPLASKEFTILNDSITETSMVVASLAYKATDNKEIDEFTMDTLNIICGKVTGRDFTMFINTTDGSYLSGEFEINYLITI